MTTFNNYLLGARETVCFVIPGRQFINISSFKVNDSIKNTKTVFIEQNDTK